MTLLPFQASLQAEHFCNLSPLLSSPASYKCWWTDYYLAVYFMYLKGVYAPSFLCWAISIPSVFPHNSCYLDICSFSLLPEDLPPVVSHLSWGYFSWTSSSIEWSRRMSIWLLWLPSCTSSQSDVCLGESTTSPIHLQLVIPCGPYVICAGLLYTSCFPFLVCAAGCSRQNTEACTCSDWILPFSFSSLSRLFYSCPQMCLLFQPV